MSQFKVDPCVLDELWEIWRYISEHDPSAAWRVIDAAFETFQTLAESPLIGTVFQARNPRIRAIRYFPVTRYPNYLVFYSPAEDYVMVHHVFHGARNLRELLA